MGIVGHKGDMPFPYWHDAGKKIGQWRPARDGWIDAQLRLRYKQWAKYGLDSRAASDSASRIYAPRDFWEWTEEELREEELEAIERMMETPPVRLSQIGRAHGKARAGNLSHIARGGW